MCSRCGGWPETLAASRSRFEFGGPVRDAIHLLKYDGQYARSEWAGTELAVAVRGAGWAIDVLVPVPLHPSRLRQRGFNQAEKIATRVSADLGIPVIHALERVRRTPSQVGRGAEERRVNVAGAFQARLPLEALRVMLVDDVVTTGSTLAECSKACAAAGALDVRALTLATDVVHHHPISPV